MRGGGGHAGMRYPTGWVRDEIEGLIATLAQGTAKLKSA